MSKTYAGKHEAAGYAYNGPMPTYDEDPAPPQPLTARMGSVLMRLSLIADEAREHANAIFGSVPEPETQLGSKATVQNSVVNTLEDIEYVVSRIEGHLARFRNIV
jgi:hypothetical protein